MTLSLIKFDYTYVTGDKASLAASQNKVYKPSNYHLGVADYRNITAHM